MTKRKKPAAPVRVVPCTNFDDFLARVRVSRWGVQRIFRGHRDPIWKLQSLWERVLEKNLTSQHPGANLDTMFGPEGRTNRNRARDQYIKAFCESANGLPGAPAIPGEPNQCWALGRHHGLVTPLLDWTHSPFVAAFFACFDYVEQRNQGFKSGEFSLLRGLQFYPRSNDPQTVAVWELALMSGLLKKNEFYLVTDRTHQAYRQKAQQGIFTILQHESHIDLESYLASRDHGNSLTRYEIPAEETGRVLYNLRLMNITWGTLFPDIEGAMMEANTGSAIEALHSMYPLPDA